VECASVACTAGNGIDANGHFATVCGEETPVPIRLLKETPALRLGSVGPVLVNIWYEEATVPALKALNEAQRAFMAEHGKITLLAISLAVPKMPDRAVADWLKANNDTYDGIRGTVIAILAGGVASVFARSFIAIVSLFAPQQYVVVKSLAAAAEAVRGLDGQPPEIASMTSLEADLEAFLALPRPE